MVHALSSQVAFQAQDYPAAIEHGRQAVVVGPDLWIGYIMLGQGYAAAGQTEPALQSLETAARLSSGNSKALAMRGHLLARIGRREEALQVLHMLEATSRERYVPPYALALVHAGLGERDAVFAALDRAYAARDVHLMFLTVDSNWDPYRADPRFAALLARCDFMRVR
jgi:tetratricopeptide (TPR) repeat protein